MLEIVYKMLAVREKEVEVHRMRWKGRGITHLLLLSRNRKQLAVCRMSGWMLGLVWCLLCLSFGRRRRSIAYMHHIQLIHARRWKKNQGKGRRVCVWWWWCVYIYASKAMVERRDHRSTLRCAFRSCNRCILLYLFLLLLGVACSTHAYNANVYAAL